MINYQYYSLQQPYFKKKTKMANVNAYINFDGNCREAMNFYKECLGGDLSMQTVGESAMASQRPESGHKILHATLSKGGKEALMDSDMLGSEGLIKANNMSLAINCDSDEQINNLFTHLSVEGNVSHQLADMFWGDKHGFLIDKLGVRWALNYAKNTK